MELYCPITLSIFYEPVLASDCQVYEKKVIEEWYNKHKTSPITREILDPQFIKEVEIENQVKEYLFLHPEEIINVFNPFDINDIINKGEYNKIQLFPYIDLNLITSNSLVKYLKNVNDFNNLKIFIDKILDLEVIINNKSKLINYLCMYSNFEIIKYVVEKNVDLHFETVNKWKIINLVCKYQNYECIKYFIEKNLNLEDPIIDGWKPIHLVCKYKSFEIIKLLVGMNINLESTNKDGVRPIHLACKYQDIDTIIYLIEKGVNINCSTKKGITPEKMLKDFKDKETYNYLCNNYNFQKNRTCSISDMITNFFTM